MRYRSLWGLGLALTLSQACLGQAVSPTAPGGRPDVNNLAHQMAERVRHLGEDITSDLGDTPVGKHLAEDTQELALAVDEFHDGLHGGDPTRARQAFSGIEVTWQHLRGQLAKGSSPAVLRAAKRVDELDAQVRDALGMNAPPPGFYEGGQAPTGIAETQRLAHALVARADSLAAAIRADMARDPNGEALSRDATALARAADVFHDSIDANQAVDVAAAAFGPVDQLADRIERYVTTNRVPARVQGAWQSFASVEVLIHQNLGLKSAQPQVQVGLTPAVAGGPPPLAGLTDRLVEQAGAFVQNFGPRGGVLLDEGRRLQAAAADFRDDVGRGLAPNQLAYEFRDVDLIARRLVRRVSRLGRGQVGPNVRQVQGIAATCEQIHRVLAMPGSPPMLGGDPTAGVNPQEVSRSARAFIEAAKRLQQAVRDVADDSPHLAQLGRVIEMAGHLGGAAEKGASPEHAAKDSRDFVAEYSRLLTALEKDHDVHHDENVAAALKQLREAYARLQGPVTVTPDSARDGR